MMSILAWGATTTPAGDWSVASIADELLDRGTTVFGTASLGLTTHRSAVVAIAVLALALACVFVWMWLTRRQILHRTTELRKSEHTYRQLLDHLEAGVVVHDPDRRILYSNIAADTMLGLHDQEALGKDDRDPAWNFLREDRSAMPIEEYPVNQVIASGRPLRQFVVGFQHSESRTTTWVMVNAFPEFSTAGQLQRVVVTFHDITQRRTLEEQLLQSQKMESVGRLAGGVAHDFNNMLTVIIGKAELAQSRLEPDHPAQSDVGEILSAAHRSAKITRQLLGFARRQTIAPRRLDLNLTVEKMLSMLGRIIGEQLDLTWRPGAGLGRVYLDPVQVDQILTNLCINARDAITESDTGTGKITISTASVGIDEAFCAEHPEFVPGDFVMLEVSDDGCGMDAETLEKVFEPFFTTKEFGEGTGLGLATVYGIVKQNGGFVSVRSERCKGTSVTIHLPRLATGDEPEQELADAPPTVVLTEPEQGRGETIMLVEDDTSILAVMDEILTDLGYRVIAVDTPDGALRLAEEHGHQIRLLITDVVMPGMDGAVLAERLLDQYPHLSVLFISGYTADVIAHRGVLDPGVNFLQKPFKVSDFANRVRTLLEAK